MNGDDKRLIENYLPIEAFSKEASRKKSCATLISLRT
jgi:hypothetical protein